MWFCVSTASIHRSFPTPSATHSRFRHFLFSSSRRVGNIVYFPTLILGGRGGSPPLVLSRFASPLISPGSAQPARWRKLANLARPLRGQAKFLTQGIIYDGFYCFQTHKWIAKRSKTPKKIACSANTTSIIDYDIILKIRGFSRLGGNRFFPLVLSRSGIPPPLVIRARINYGRQG